MARRSPGGVVGLVAFLAMLVVAGGVVLAVVAVRALTPDPYDNVASLSVTTVLLIAAAVVWWIALDRNADTLERHREGMIDVLAKSADV
jgi:cytochrome bd-type quinol oxidase subunit 2